MQTLGCVVYPWYSILLNGTSKSFFGASRGLRQRNPSSLFLFSLVVDQCPFQPCSSCQSDSRGLKPIQVSYLPFLRDTVVFINPETECILNLKHTLKDFEPKKVLILGLSWVNLYSAQLIDTHNYSHGFSMHSEDSSLVSRINSSMFFLYGALFQNLATSLRNQVLSLVTCQITL